MSIPGSATPLLLATTAAAGPAAAFQVDRSLRFNSADSAYLSRTPSSAGNRRTFTFSCWVKAPKIAGIQQIIFSASTGSTPYTAIDFRDNNFRIIEWNGSSVVFQVKTDAILRDPSAWYHVVIAVDTTQSTAANRVKIYINGTQQTSFATASYPSQNHQLYMNSSALHYVGENAATSYTAFLNGYLTEVHFVDGQALAATDFGELDDNNNWNPKEFSGTYGTNGFKLNFSDNSSNEALGYDQSVATPSPNPDGGMDVVTWTGNGSTQTISGLGFQPDFVWIKARSAAYDHYLQDVVRGATKTLEANQTGAETTNADGVTEFTSDGFKLGAGTGNTAPNVTNVTYVGWAWKAGGAAVSNTDGSLTSQVSASTDYGFSIVTGTTPSSGVSSYGHGLDTAPKLMLVKLSNVSANWHIYSEELGNTGYLYFTSAAAGTTTALWDSTSPTNSVFTLGTSFDGSYNFVAYCWSEVSGFSKFGSYSGSGSSGNAVTTGFKPRYVLLKRTDSTGNWFIFDSARGTGKTVWADLPDDEESSYSITITANGFTVNGTASGMNATGGTYIYAAFADRPGNNFDVNNLVATAGADGAAGFDVVTYSGNGGAQVIGGPAYSTQTLSAVSSSETVTNPGRAFNGSTSNSAYTFNGIKFTPIGGSQSNVTSLRFYSESYGQGGTIKLNGTTIETNYDFGNGGWYSFSSTALSNINNTLTSFEWNRQPGQGSNNNDYLNAVEINGTVLIDGAGAPLKFQPDLVWIKSRSSGTEGHYIANSINGLTENMRSNSTSAEQTNTNGVTAADANTFTLGDSGRVNGTSQNYVAWAWNAGANSNKTYTVKVVSDSGNKYRFDDFGTSAVTLDLQEGSTYVFDQSDSSNAGHPIRFGTSANGTDYTTGVTHTGTPGSAGAKTTLVLGTGVATLYYSCANHSGMGGQINTNSTAGASNFDGSIQSTVKANQEYGFSIVSTSPSNNAVSIGHGLNATPSVIISKSRTVTYDWNVMHASLGGDEIMRLNTTAAKQTVSNYYNSIGTSTFSVISGNNANNSGDMVYYCWSEISGFSKFGSYSGGTNPRTITTGFKTAFVLIKSSSHSSHWQIIDATRGGTQKLASDLSAAENDSSTLGGTSTNTVEFLDDGFKLTTTNTGTNQSGYTYIYMAFAGTPDGSGVDSLIDTPTNYDASSGNNGGNYCTLNPLHAPAIVGSGTSPTITNGNLDVTGNNQETAGTFGASSGKWYYEVTQHDAGNFTNGVGWYREGTSEESIYRDDGAFRFNGSESSYGASWQSAGDVIGIALDIDNNTIAFYKNGASQGNAKTNLPAGTYIPLIYNRQVSDLSANFGQRPFVYTPPTGHKSLCTQNLADPTIADGSTAFDAKLWTGTGSSRSITGYGFSPDLAWIKSRSGAYVHYWVDTVRGAAKRLQSNSTTTELNSSQSLTAFNSDGFDLGNEQAVNENNDTFVGWAWDAGASTVSNTDGSITANVRANASAGFSICSYTGIGDGSTESFGHGLNAAPEFVIIKNRDSSTNWAVYHKGGGAGATYRLDDTNAKESTSMFDSQHPSSSVVYLKENSNRVNNPYDYVAYCFAPVAGYSAFGSYTGNGSSDGPFVYTGFRPRFLLFKCSSAIGNWIIIDSARDTFNDGETAKLAPNHSYEENNSSYIGFASQTLVDFTSNGFKLRSTGGTSNDSGATYIWAAFCEHPFKTARAR